MLKTLELRYGVSMSQATIDNQLAEMRRKPGESLHRLYDRVTALAQRADYSENERAFKQRYAFFQALRTDSDLQHYVGRWDKADPPNIDVTLAIAKQYEMSYGPKYEIVTSSGSPSPLESATDGHGTMSQCASSTSVPDTLVRQLGENQTAMVNMMRTQYDAFEQHLAARGRARSQRSRRDDASVMTATSTPRRRGPARQQQPHVALGDDLQRHDNQE
jgi:hypothetical protein